jgi:hypothetical protein
MMSFLANTSNLRKTTWIYSSPRPLNEEHSTQSPAEHLSGRMKSKARRIREESWGKDTDLKAKK